ncbi:o-acyltransferase (membrane bound) domain containing protein, putative [Ricinus communis]|uniref:O-acyltransferase (Membrane bound) domain containing protein, putative n=1 Tax=Ricinus communis TaxID=3988 RepID=B9RC25_RICCO|nr:o-acyltransferase (membrane bound) domain containing protein, putative [Ricinus communis]
MDLDLESMASAIGVSIPVLRFLLCFVATIPVSFMHRLAPGSLGKHLYAALTGAFLSYLSFGFSSNLHFLVPMLLGYASMVLFRSHCGILVFLLGFGYLIGCHVYYMSGDAWKEGGIDATGALMVLTLKVISCAINYKDGLLKEEELQGSQKKNRLIKLPSLIEYFGYCLCCGSHFAGPVYEMKDYLEWTERKGIWAGTEKGPSPSPFGATIRAILQAAICMVIHLYLVPHYPLSRFTDPVYQEWGFWKRLTYQYMSGLTARWKYYFIWSISEASIIISGLGFSGWTDTSPPKPQWDRARNVDILGVEFAKSAAELPLVWNIQVSTWLRHCEFIAFSLC